LEGIGLTGFLFVYLIELGMARELLFARIMPFVDREFRHGGIGETHFNPSGPAGDG
jgi:hypothetical protein